VMNAPQEQAAVCDAAFQKCLNVGIGSIRVNGAASDLTERVGGDEMGLIPIKVYALRGIGVANNACRGRWFFGTLARVSIQCRQPHRVWVWAGNSRTISKDCIKMLLNLLNNFRVHVLTINLLV